MNVTDQFSTSINTQQRKPALQCNPASVDGAPLSNPSDHLVCYKTKSEKLDPRPRIELSDVFGTIQIEARTATYFRTPSSKTVMP